MTLLKINPVTGELDLVQDLGNISDDVNILSGVLNVGVDDTQYGTINVFGHAASSNRGGEIYLYSAADHDTTNEYYLLQATSDTFQLGPQTKTDGILRYDESTGFIHLARENGNTAIGASQSVRGLMYLYGNDTTLGGQMRFYVGKTNINVATYFLFGAVNDDFWIGSNVKNDQFVLTAEGKVGIGTNTPNSILELNMSTENLEFVNAGSAGATEQDWIQVEVGGNTGYIRVFASV